MTDQDRGTSGDRPEGDDPPADEPDASAAADDPRIDDVILHDPQHAEKQQHEHGNRRDQGG